VSDASSNVWYADGLHFTCTQCGNCCSGAPGFVWVQPEEVRKIAAFVGMDTTEFETRHTRSENGRKSLLEHPGGDCEFLEREPSGKTRCRIHPVRPVQCRTWPFWDSNLKNRRAWDSAARACPGMNAGAHHPLPVIQDALRRNQAAQLPL
jgi:Fe-S-cluster containining protein